MTSFARCSLLHYMTDEPIYLYTTPSSHVVIRTRWFVVMCFLSALGAFTLLFILTGA